MKTMTTSAAARNTAFAAIEPRVRKLWRVVFSHTDINAIPAAGYPGRSVEGSPVLLAREPGAESRDVAHGVRTYWQLDSSLAHSIVRSGIPTDVIEPLALVLDLNAGEVANLLSLDRTTAARRKTRGQSLPPHSAEAVLRLADMEGLAHDTFEDLDQAHTWLKKPHPMLDGESPYEAARTSFGADRVREMLVGIKYGGVV